MGGLQSRNKQHQAPFNMTNEQIKKLVKDTNEMLSEHKYNLSLDISIDLNSLNYAIKDRRKMNVTATARIVSEDNILVKNDAEKVFIDLEQLHLINQLLNALRKEKSLINSTPTPNQQSDKQCCICFDAKASTVLPCSHSYCAACTSRYIIEPEEHRCPECRAEFIGSKSSVKRQFYEVIEDNKLVFEEARNMILSYLRKYNVIAVQILSSQLSVDILK